MHCGFKMTQLTACKNVQYNTIQYNTIHHYTGHLSSMHLGYVLAEFNNCPTRCNLFSLLHFCRQLYMFRVLTPNSSITNEYLPYDTHESVPTQRERMVVDPGM